jgi:hypothetical protein
LLTSSCCSLLIPSVPPFAPFRLHHLPDSLSIHFPASNLSSHRTRNGRRNQARRHLC